MADNKKTKRAKTKRGVRRHGRLAARILVGAAAVGSSLPAVHADPGDRFHITAQERAACTSDAIRFCMHTYPDEDQLLACMKQNRDALSAPCRLAFDAGVKRRRL